MPQVLVVPLGEDGSLPAPDEVEVLPISGDLEYGEGFNVNGDRRRAGRARRGPHRVWRAVPRRPGLGLRHAHRFFGDAMLTTGDGMELDGDTLYVVRNQVNQIDVLELDEGATSATLVAELADDGFDVPTTVALLDGDLWAVNARFGTDATADTEYWITRLDATRAGED